MPVWKSQEEAQDRGVPRSGYKDDVYDTFDLIISLVCVHRGAPSLPRSSPSMPSGGIAVKDVELDDEGR